MERLKRYLEDEDISQAEFARRMGVSQPTVSDWLSGAFMPSTQRLKAMSKLTGISIDELLAAPSHPHSSELRA